MIIYRKQKNISMLPTHHYGRMATYPRADYAHLRQCNNLSINLEFIKYKYHYIINLFTLKSL